MDPARGMGLSSTVEDTVFTKRGTGASFRRVGDGAGLEPISKVSPTVPTIPSKQYLGKERDDDVPGGYDEDETTQIQALF